MVRQQPKNKKGLLISSEPESKLSNNRFCTCVVGRWGVCIS